MDNVGTCTTHTSVLSRVVVVINTTIVVVIVVVVIVVVVAVAVALVPRVVELEVRAAGGV
jgi:ABC-type dipeptide/oligopeptide/nickel transport system permease subunit